ncbi:hypothetical protein C8R45DRAFT_938753 [Mycena sanguinolenta]|nr:hypothetical protein C8R45DRAFT_938753 [Mycena sanguinolenta]
MNTEADMEPNYIGQAAWVGRRCWNASHRPSNQEWKTTMKNMPGKLHMQRVSESKFERECGAGRSQKSAGDGRNAMHLARQKKQTCTTPREQKTMLKNAQGKLRMQRVSESCGFGLHATASASAGRAGASKVRGMEGTRCIYARTMSGKGAEMSGRQRWAEGGAGGAPTCAQQGGRARTTEFWLTCQPANCVREPKRGFGAQNGSTINSNRPPPVGRRRRRRKLMKHRFAEVPVVPE